MSDFRNMSAAASFEPLPENARKTETAGEQELADVIRLFPETADESVREEILGIFYLDRKIGDLQEELELVRETMAGAPEEWLGGDLADMVKFAWTNIEAQVLELADKLRRKKLGRRRITDDEYGRLREAEGLLAGQLAELEREEAAKLKRLPAHAKILSEELAALKSMRSELHGASDAGEALFRKESGVEFAELMNREREALKKFFGFEIEVPPLPPEITPEKYKEWKEKGLELHYLPPIEMKEDSNFPGWKQKPGKKFTPGQQYGIEFFEAIKKGELPADAAKLSGAWTLIDTRRKPQYSNGDQRYDDDVLEPVLEKLRKKKLIGDFEGKGSRFNISSYALEKPAVREALAKALGIPVEAFHLPRVIDNNYLVNAFYPEWGETDSSEWFEDVYQSNERLFGGDSDYGGLSIVNWLDADDRDDFIGFRPLGRFSPKK